MFPFASLVRTEQGFNALIGRLIRQYDITDKLLIVGSHGSMIFRPGIPQLLHGILAAELGIKLSKMSLETAEEHPRFQRALAASTVSPFDLVAGRAILAESIGGRLLDDSWGSRLMWSYDRAGARSQFLEHVLTALMRAVDLRPVQMHLVNSVRNYSQASGRTLTQANLFTSEVVKSVIKAMNNWKGQKFDYVGTHWRFDSPFETLPNVPIGALAVLEQRTRAPLSTLAVGNNIFAGYLLVTTDGEAEEFYKLMYLLTLCFGLTPETV